MAFFWFIVIQFSFLAIVAFSVHYSGWFRRRKDRQSSPPFFQDRRDHAMRFLNPRTEPGIFARNLKTNESVFFPSRVEDEASISWIVGLFAATVALGCLAGFTLYKIWDFILYYWF